MSKSTKRKIVAGSVAALAVAGGGAAIAATQFGSPKEESQAVVNDAAQQLGVKPDALSNALKKALENRVDAAVAAGRITKAEGAALKQRIESGELPLFRGPHGPGGPGEPHAFPHLGAAASYLGLSESQLRTRLDSGRTLAQVAKDAGKSVDGLIDALVADEKKELDASVAAGRLTRAQADELLKGAKQRFTDLVNGKRPSFRGRHGFPGPQPGERGFRGTYIEPAPTGGPSL